MAKPIDSMVLAGDSIIDNTKYVGPGQDTLTYLESRFAQGEQFGTNLEVVSLAEDGALASDTEQQLKSYHNTIEVPVSTVVISCGGNDALQQFLGHQPPATLTRHVFKAGVDAFRVTFAEILGRAVHLLGTHGAQRVTQVYALAIYNPPFEDPDLRALGELVTSAYNDAIYRECARATLPESMKVGNSHVCPVQVIDLRDHCTSDEHFTDEIEPSAFGSQAIAAAIWHAHMMRHPMKTLRPVAQVSFDAAVEVGHH